LRGGLPSVIPTGMADFFFRSRRANVGRGGEGPWQVLSSNDDQVRAGCRTLASFKGARRLRPPQEGGVFFVSLRPTLVILRASDKVRCLDSGGFYRRCPKNLSRKFFAGFKSKCDIREEWVRSSPPFRRPGLQISLRVEGFTLSPPEGFTLRIEGPRRKPSPKQFFPQSLSPP